MRLWKVPVIVALALVALAPIASAQKKPVQQTQQRVVVVRRYYAYDPFYWDRYAWMYGYPPYNSAYYPPTTGDVKLKTDRKDAMLYVDGGYAGKAKDRKHFSLPPGTHKIELRDVEGQVIAKQTVHIVLHKTVTLDFRG